MFSKLFNFQGLRKELCEACDILKWKSPTRIQQEAIPLALQGKFKKKCYHFIQMMLVNFFATPDLSNMV